jgi:hypothetical protein
MKTPTKREMERLAKKFHKQTLKFLKDYRRMQKLSEKQQREHPIYFAMAKAGRGA